MEEDDKKVLSIYDSEDKILERILATDDPDEIEKLANALSKVHNGITEETKACNELVLKEKEIDQNKEIEEQKLKQEKRKNLWMTLGTIGAAVIGALGVIGGQYVKGEMDSRYQDEGYEHEKTESVIWNKNRHKR